MKIYPKAFFERCQTITKQWCSSWNATVVAANTSHVVDDDDDDDDDDDTLNWYIADVILSDIDGWIHPSIHYVAGWR